MDPLNDFLADFGDDGDETEVVRVREETFVNDQRVEPAVKRLASEDEEVDTAVVSFFDVDYVRSGEDKQVYGERARERLLNRQAPNSAGFIRK